MRYILPFILLSALLLFCNPPAEQPATPTTPDSIADTIASQIKAMPVIDTAKLKLIADSFVSKITAGDNLNYSITVEQVKKNGQYPFNEEYFFKSLFTGGNEKVLWYKFTPQKGARIYRFWMIEARYANPKDRNRAMEVLKYLGSEEDSTKTPALTYSQDYILATDTIIYWFNTGSSYGTKNHTQLAKMMLGGVPKSLVKDSLICPGDCQ